MGSRARDAVGAWIDSGRPHYVKARTRSELFLSSRGTSLSRVALWAIVRKHAKRAGITKWVGFHTFRHTYSTLLKANGEDVKVVQELMRHANISTTMNIYTKALTPAKREAQRRVVDVLMDRSRILSENAAEDAA